MLRQIQKELEMIESKFDVKILYACESGSRAWGFPSQDSDYDVRFIYVHRPDWYLSIDDGRDVIELPIDDLLDINGWDIRKALKLFRKSNPPLHEWLQSDIVYYRAFSFVDRLHQLVGQVYSPKSCMHHYLNMARNNYREYLQGEQVKIKKYFYVLRPVLACIWIAKYHSNPPLLFETLVDRLIHDPILSGTIMKLLARKKQGDELDLEPRIPALNSWIESNMAWVEEQIRHLPSEPEDPTAQLNQLFRDTLAEVYAPNGL